MENMLLASFWTFQRPLTLLIIVTLSIDNQPIHQAESSKFLGLYIDEKLYWKLHISYLAGKIARGVGIILKARKYFTNECMVQLYNAFIVPYLMYCNQIWGNTYKSNLRKLQVLQNKAVRIITGSSRKTSIEWMYNEFRILNLYEINLYLVGKFMFKVFHEDVPNVFDNFFTDEFMSTMPGVLNIYTYPCVYQTGMRYQGPIIWNNILKAEINPMCSEALFKIMLKKCLFNQIIKVWIMS